MQNESPAPLGFLLADCSRLLRRRFEQESRDVGMSPAQLKIVARLTMSEGIGQAALAAMLDLEPMTLSRHIDRMEEAGLVERRPDPNDRRARQLFTTEKGRALLAPMRERAARIYEEVQVGLSEAKRAALIAALQTIIRNLSAAEDRAAPHGTGRSGPEKEVA
jgi:MarR family transcriptional regulator, transcriptional regulator for hemolysin